MKKNSFIQLGLVLISILIGVSALSVTADLNSDKLVSIPAADLVEAYNGLRDFNGQGGMFGLNELSTDELVAPTRGGDWDDNGMWRELHTHRWGPSHSEVRNTWNSLFRNAQTCNKVIKYGTTSEKLQARFLKAFYYYNLIDFFGQVPYSETGLKSYGYENNDIKTDVKVLSRSEATDFIISELEDIVTTLPARTTNDASIANKDAAHFLLAKIYLNKAVFKAPNPAGPYVFSASDMTKVVQHVDALTNTLATNYWSNFAPNNNTSSEIIFSSKNNRGGSGGAMQSKWRMGNHYNQTPDGWNGFTTVADYYSTFNAADKRAHYAVPGYTFTVDANGKGLGFLQGQMYKNGIVSTANALKDRNNNPLNFTTNITLITSGATAETAGVRGMKYIPDADNLGQPDNDLILMRYADALLMKAEAILRGGTGTGMSIILNELATRAGVSVAPSTLDGIYAERGRELWWEGWRRNDMIRFGKYLNSRQLKPFVSNSKYLLFPIPTEALYNVNIKQNPGY